MGFRDLRVINEDYIEANGGFGTHPHRDMEIITYVMEGSLEHQDSMGVRAAINADGFQRITAGTGITHSEINPSSTERLHLIQIWLLPERQGLKPSYEEYSPTLSEPGLTLIAASDPAAGAMKIHQDAKIFIARQPAGHDIEYRMDAGRHAWIQITKGAVSVNGNSLTQGDGASISDESSISVTPSVASEFLLFDLK